MSGGHEHNSQNPGTGFNYGYFDDLNRANYHGGGGGKDGASTGNDSHSFVFMAVGESRSRLYAHN